MTSFNKKTLPMVLALAGVLGLAGCSSKPAPWAEKSSPWDAPAEESAEQPAAEVDSMIMADEMVEPAMPMPAEQEASPMMAETQVEMVEPVVVVEPEPVVIEEAAPAMVAGGSLAQQPANYYAVQVVASSTMKQLSDFASANQISEQWVAETMVGGKTWYVLMLGVYPTRGEAEQALAGVQGLPTQPWIRSVGSVQSVMK